MVHVGRLQQIQLSQIFQRIEIHEKTGLLTITRGEQEVRLYFQLGCLMYISLLEEHIPPVNRILHAEVNREQFYACARQEAIEIVQNLLTWQEEEVYFDEGAQPPTDQFLIGLRLSSLLPSLLGSTAPLIVSISNPEPIVNSGTTMTHF